MKKPSSNGWSSTPPNAEGFWWLFGDEEFGTMGGNYTGSYPPEMELRIVEVRTMGSGDGKSLYGVAGGRMVPLTPFDAEKRKPGFVGVWQKAVLPDLPDVATLPR
jgi:hypothetical protein